MGIDDYSDGNLGQSETYYLKGGIRQRWNPLGHTVLYGEYEHIKGNNLHSRNLQSQLSLPALLRPARTEDTTKVWGLGAVQEIDAAAMSIWLKYRHLDYDDNNTVGTGYKSFDYVGMGALINF